MMNAVLLLACVATLFSQGLAQICYSQEPNPYRFYSSLTRYENIPGNLPNFGNNPPGCQPVMIFLLVRNGIRTPNNDELRMFEQRLPGLRQRILNSQTGQLCQQDLDNLANWRLLVNATTTDLLTKSGEDEVKDLAARFRNRYPGLLNKPYSQRDFLIRHAYRPGRANAATAFAEGLGFNATDAQGPTAAERDLLLQFSANCNSDDNDIDDDDDLEDFRELEQVRNMVAGMTARLGLAPNSLSLEDIDAMYKICAYDYALTKASPWCAAFVTSDLQLLELKEDLIHSELYGYDDDINQLETCVLMKDFVGRLSDRQLQNNQLPAAVMYFAKTETFLPFITSLGLFEDDDDLEIDDDGIQNLASRSWKTSLINPFMSNFAMVLESCPTNTGVPQFNVRAMVNEVPVTLPACEANPCPLERLMEEIQEFAEDCSFEELCDGVSATTVSYALLSLMAVASVLYGCLFS